MEVVFAHEALADCFAECDALMHDYYDTTIASKDVPPLDFNWPFYLSLEHNKQIVLVTARVGTELAGLVFYIVSLHPQYKTVKMAVCNTLGVRPKHRRMGIARGLMSAAEPLLIANGVSRVMHTYRMVYEHEAEPLFPKLGYSLYEQVYSKDLSAH